MVRSDVMLRAILAGIESILNQKVTQLIITMRVDGTNVLIMDPVSLRSIGNSATRFV